MGKSCALISFFICPNKPLRYSAHTLANNIRKGEEYCKGKIDNTNPAEMQACPFKDSLCFIHSHPANTLNQNKPANNKMGEKN